MAKHHVSTGARRVHGRGVILELSANEDDSFEPDNTKSIIH